MAREDVETTRTTNDTEVTDRRPAPSGSTIAERVVYLLGGLLLVLLAIRFLLSLLGANRDNTFADFIYGVTYPFVAPFFGLFGYEVEYGVSRFEIETVVAILVYAALIAFLSRLVTIGRSRREEV